MASAVRKQGGNAGAQLTSSSLCSPGAQPVESRVDLPQPLLGLEPPPRHVRGWSLQWFCILSLAMLTMALSQKAGFSTSHWAPSVTINRTVLAQGACDA